MRKLELNFRERRQKVLHPYLEKLGAAMTVYALTKNHKCSWENHDASILTNEEGLLSARLPLMPTAVEKALKDIFDKVGMEYNYKTIFSSRGERSCFELDFMDVKPSSILAAIQAIESAVEQESGRSFAETVSEIEKYGKAPTQHPSSKHKPSFTYLPGGKGR